MNPQVINFRLGHNYTNMLNTTEEAFDEVSQEW